MSEILQKAFDPIRGSADTVHHRLVFPYITRGSKVDREVAHEHAIDLMKNVQNLRLVDAMGALFNYRDPILKIKVKGIEHPLPNPLFIAPGFDKKLEIHKLLGEGFGFGGVKVGTVTLIPYGGNPRKDEKGNPTPRIFDLPNNRGLINRMGFPGDGAQKAKERLEKDDKERDYGLIISVGASMPSFKNGTAIEDYATAVEILAPFGDGFEINISSPNTEGVRAMIDVLDDLSSRLDPIFEKTGKAVFYKLSPDLTTQQLEGALIILKKHICHGVALTNTTTDQNVRLNLLSDKYIEEKGGISGQPLKDKALKASRNAYKFMGEEMPISRAGGIADIRDLWIALTQGGATTAEVYTAFVRRETSGPNFVYYMMKDLAKAMRRLEMQSMDDFQEYRGKNLALPTAGVIFQSFKPYE